MAQAKDLRKLIKKGQAAGWDVIQLKANHYCWKHPDGGMFYTSSTPSDYRAIVKIEHEIRKTHNVPNRGR